MTEDRAGVEGRAAKAALISTFLATTAIAGSRRQPPAGALEVGLMGLASYRIGRIVAFERVAQPLREPFTATVPHESGADETVVARGRGVRWVIGELASCPTCVATWAALGLSVGRSFLPGPTRLLTTVIAVSGVAEIAHSGVEWLEWTARAARKASAPDRE